MTNHVVLDNIAHKDLRVKHHYSSEYGHNIGAVRSFSTEWSDIQREYPIMIHRDHASDNYQAIVMLGLSPTENLFLQAPGWKGKTIPAMFAKGPFLVGYEDQSSSGGERRARVIHVDLDDPRVNASDGHPVFMPHGGHTDYLTSVSSVLDSIEQGVSVDQNMFTMFAELDLIEPIAMNIELANGEQIRVEGQYTISRQRLSSLSGDELFRLNRVGFLQGAFIISNSLNNISRLIELKNAKIASQ